MAVASRRRLEKGLLFRCFVGEGKIRGLGRAPWEVGPPQAPPGRGNGGEAAPAGRLGPPWLPSDPTSGSSKLLVRGFSVNFLGIF